MGSLRKPVAIGMTAGLLLLVLVVALPEPASGQSRTWTSDTDWQSGTMDANIVMTGTGPGSYLELRRSDFPDWMQMSPATVPPKREAPCLAWSADGNYFLLFGGYGSRGVLGDTWTYNFTNDQWTQLNLATHPSNRTNTGCAYDPFNHVIVLFGGMDASFLWSFETWEFDTLTQTWSQAFPTTFPTNQMASPLTFDIAHGRFITIFVNTRTSQMETWAYDAATDTWTNRAASFPGTAPRDGHMIAYDTGMDRTLMFSGGWDLNLYCDFFLYAYTPNTWTKVRDCIENEDPNARVTHGMAYRDSSNGVLMYGGRDMTSYPPETWLYIGSLQDWHLPPVTASPGARGSVRLAHSIADDATILFGGYNPIDGLMNHTWAYAKGYVQGIDAVWTSGSTPEDAGCANVNYQNIYWNRTSQPLGAILRFQIATSTSPSGPWTFRGPPDGFPGQHYTTSGTAIWNGHDGQRYFRLLGKLRTANGLVTPRLEDATITWTCPPTPPYVQDTNPASGQTTHPINAPIWVNFSEPMQQGTVTWAITGITLTGSWSNNDQTLMLTPNQNFRDCTNYTAQILTGRDVNDDLNLVAGPVPNPWTFRTVCINPYIVSTNPTDGAFNVPVGQSVVATFNEPMNMGTVTFTVTPDPGGLAPSWNGNRDQLTIGHTAFVECTVYTVEVTAGVDDQGLPLTAGPVPNPWSFFTFCPNPVIVATNPADGDTGVALNAPERVTFSKAMNIATVTYTINPGVTWGDVRWTAGNTVLTLWHNASLFAEITRYMFRVTGGQDTGALPLVPGPVPNPFNFTAIGINPFIQSTDPAAGATRIATGANIVITFSEPMIEASVSFTFSDPGITFTRTWNSNPPADTVLTLTHVTPFSQCTLYTVQVLSGTDLAGLPLVPGPVPNPWSFRTICPLGAPRGLTLLRLPPSTILLDWADVVGATAYKVYESQNRFANFPSGWTLVGTPAASQLTVGTLADGLTHYYVVRATDGTQDGPNSSMGVKTVLTFGHSTVNTNIAWFSLPYTSIYRRASDIATDLGPTNINLIGKWDPARQTSDVYYYSRGRWRGTDFAINPGDGLYLGVNQAFPWILTGTDADVTLSFTLNPPGKQNVNWVGLPYTGVYQRASDLGTALGSTRITEIGLWDASTQSVTRYYWTGSTWAGTDFTFAPGAGLYIIIVSIFTWTPALITPAVP